MTTRSTEVAPQAMARLAGFLYLWVIPLGIFGGLYVSSRVIVSGEAAATAANLVTSEGLFRLGIVAELFSALFMLFTAVTLYQLFKPVNASVARLMLLCVVAGAAIAMLNKLNQLAALQLASGADFLDVFTPAQQQALAYLFLRLHSRGSEIAFIFWGLWLLPLAYLVYQSGFMPRPLAGLLVIAAGGYLVDTFTSLLGYPVNIGLFTAWGEILFVLWLLIKGVNLTQWQQRALATA